ncbi:MAG: 50S ribosomal protein L17 [Candidatus Kerfeldbacteria bacterium]
MRHRSTKKRMGRKANHRKMLIRNLAKSFFTYEKIETTVAKAKFMKPYVEKIITTGKKDTLTSRRLILKKLGTNKLAEKILKDISPRYADKKGGYTRITKIGVRKGDGAETVYLTLV